MGSPSGARDDLPRVLAEHGWVVVSTPPQDGLPASTSTVGLTGRGLPELVVLGLDDETAGALLHELALRLLDGRTYVDGEPVDGLVDGTPDPSLDEPLRPTGPLPAVELYGERVRVRQLVWPDAEGRLPGDEGFAHDELQPLFPGEPESSGPVVPDAWPLPLDPHTEVLSSLPATEGEPVLSIYREADGGWLFLDGAHDFVEEQAVTECLHDVVGRDRTLVDVVGRLVPGDLAERDEPGSPWRVEQW